DGQAEEGPFAAGVRRRRRLFHQPGCSARRSSRRSNVPGIAATGQTGCVRGNRAPGLSVSTSGAASAAGSRSEPVAAVSGVVQLAEAVAAGYGAKRIVRVVRYGWTRRGSLRSLTGGWRGS